MRTDLTAENGASKTGDDGLMRIEVAAGFFGEPDSEGRRPAAVRIPIPSIGLSGNLTSGRQLRAARNLAGLTQADLSLDAGFNRDACQYWERSADDYPSTVQTTLDRIEAALARHGVIPFTEPTPGCRLAPRKATAR